MKIIIEMTPVDEGDAISVRTKGIPTNRAQHVLARVVHGVLNDIFGDDNIDTARTLEATSERNPVKQLMDAYAKFLRVPEEERTIDCENELDNAIMKDILIMQAGIRQKSNGGTDGIN